MSQKNRHVLIFDDSDELSDYAVEKWRELSHEAIRNKGRFAVALSGGRTPLSLYAKLSSSRGLLPWSKTHVFLVDERFVSFKDDENNLRMIYRTLLKKVKIPKINIHSIPTEEKTPEMSAGKYEEGLRSFFKLARGRFPRFDLIMLGIGEDGHTASLFPESAALHETHHSAVAVSLRKRIKHERITITFPVINNAKNIIFLVTGQNKADTVRQVLEDRNARLPAAGVKPKKGKLFFLLDKQAAFYLKYNINNEIVSSL